MSTPETPVSSQIARWENMRKLVETWQPPYHWPNVEEFTARVAQIERELDERCPGWHELWSGDLSRIADWVAAARPPETPRDALARFAKGGQLDPEMRVTLESYGWIRSVPAVTVGGRAILEEDGTVPREWGND